MTKAGKQRTAVADALRIEAGGFSQLDALSKLQAKVSAPVLEAATKAVEDSNLMGLDARASHLLGVAQQLRALPTDRNLAKHIASIHGALSQAESVSQSPAELAKAAGLKVDPFSDQIRQLRAAFERSDADEMLRIEEEISKTASPDEYVRVMGGARFLNGPFVERLASRLLDGRLKTFSGDPRALDPWMDATPIAYGFEAFQDVRLEAHGRFLELVKPLDATDLAALYLDTHFPEGIKVALLSLAQAGKDPAFAEVMASRAFDSTVDQQLLRVALMVHGEEGQAMLHRPQFESLRALAIMEFQPQEAKAVVMAETRLRGFLSALGVPYERHIGYQFEAKYNAATGLQTMGEHSWDGDITVALNKAGTGHEKWDRKPGDPPTPSRHPLSVIKTLLHEVHHELQHRIAGREVMRSSYDAQSSNSRDPDVRHAAYRANTWEIEARRIAGLADQLWQGRFEEGDFAKAMRALIPELQEAWTRKGLEAPHLQELAARLEAIVEGRKADNQLIGDDR